MRSLAIDQLNTLTDLHVHEAGNDQLFLVASCPQPVSARQAAADAYERIAKVLAITGMQIVQERVFGNVSVEKAVMTARQEAFRTREILPDGPVTYIQGCPPWGEGLAGVIIHATSPHDRVSTIMDGPVACGKRWRQNGNTFLILQNIQGIECDSKSTGNPSLQAQSMFEQAERILHEQGFTYRQVVRTWFYLSDILGWYSQFNQIRNAQYDTFGIMPKSGKERLLLPSSTGVRADNPHSSACTMDLMAVAGHPDSQPIIKQMSNSGQEDAFRYGASFSRGTSIRQGDVSLIQVSGTAAIDKHGRSLYPDDVRAQIDCTFDKIESLIGQEGATLKDICAATVFVKYPEDVSVYRERAAARGLDDFPGVCVVADVCREELLFEIDAEVAFVNSSLEAE